jgi:N-acetylneuraminic acid mutarotase
VATPLPTAVSGGLVLSDGSFIYLFGGWDGQDYLANAYRFDPANNSWQILPSMTTARAFVAGGVVKGKLYVVGGYDGERPLTECAYFDPTTSGGDESAEIDGSWHTCADMLLPRAGASAAGLLNKLYLFGGGAFSEASITYSESYNPDADQWSVVNTPQLDDQPNWSHLGITYIETKIYAVGGERDSVATADTFVYRPLAYQTFIPIAPVENNGSNEP